MDLFCLQAVFLAQTAITGMSMRFPHGMSSTERMLAMYNGANEAHSEVGNFSSFGLKSRLCEQFENAVTVVGSVCRYTLCSCSCSTKALQY
jgi:hypothetical protein